MRCCTHPESRQVAAYNPAGLVFSYITGVFNWLPSGVIELTIDMMVRGGRYRSRGFNLMLFPALMQAVPPWP